MADETTPVVAATGADANAAVAHATDDVVKHTPEPPVTTAPAHEAKADPSEGSDGLDALKSTVEGLANAVANLTDIVTKQATPDESPERVPWLLRGKRSV